MSCIWVDLSRSFHTAEETQKARELTFGSSDAGLSGSEGNMGNLSITPVPQGETPIPFFPELLEATKLPDQPMASVGPSDRLTTVAPAAFKPIVGGEVPPSGFLKRPPSEEQRVPSAGAGFSRSSGVLEESPVQQPKKRPRIEPKDKKDFTAILEELKVLRKEGEWEKIIEIVTASNKGKLDAKTEGAILCYYAEALTCTSKADQAERITRAYLEKHRLSQKNKRAANLELARALNAQNKYEEALDTLYSRVGTQDENLHMTFVVELVQALNGNENWEEICQLADLILPKMDQGGVKDLLGYYFVKALNFLGEFEKAQGEATKFLAEGTKLQWVFNGLIEELGKASSSMNTSEET